MSTRTFVESITSGFPDDLTPLPDTNSSFHSSGSSTNIVGFFSSITWQTWLIIILILALLGINIFTYLAKGTQDIVTISQKILQPIFKLFGYTVLETTKKTIEMGSAGTEAGINVVTDTSVNSINKLEKLGGANGSTNGINGTNGMSSTAVPTSGTSVGVATSGQTTAEQTTAEQNGGQIPVSSSQSSGQYSGQMAKSSQSGASIQNEMEIAQKEESFEKWQQQSLNKALSNASQTANEIQPNDTSISVGKSGWCYIGSDLGVRTCSEVGVNDMCMSGDIFPSQTICMNPNLRP